MIMRKLMVWCTLVLSGLWATQASEAQTLRVVRSSKPVASQMAALSVHIGGRVITRSNVAPYGGNTYTHQWPGVYFEAKFNGQRLYLKFADPFNEYRLSVDGGTALPIKQVGTAELAITGLTPGRHRLRLEKVTESIDVVGAFQGFFVPTVRNAESVQGRKRQIEFIGDSSMTGYGLRSKTRQCTQEQVRLLSDTQSSYPALVAKHFGADYQVNAVSGRGMVRNYDGFSPEIALPKIYPYALLDTTKSWRNSSWKPQITFIALGDNDFSTPLKPDETWPTSLDLYQNYVDTFVQLLSKIHARNPKTSLVILWPELNSFRAQLGTSAITAGQKSILASAKSLGFTSVNVIGLNDLGLTFGACDYHATASDHLKLRRWLITYLDARQKLWQGQ
jgi:lysophospholipase L1-like esterase